MEKVLILLGAGASSEAGIPTSTQMTNFIVENVRSNTQAHYNGSSDAINYIIGQIIGHGTSNKQNYNDPVDVEQLFTAVKLLSERNDLEIAPFVESWKPGVRAFDRKRLASFFASDFTRALMSGNSVQLENLLKEVIQAETGMIGGDVYKNLLGYMMIALREVVNIEDVSVIGYLKPIVDIAKKQKQLTVATVNYDRSIELICEKEDIPFSTGIESFSERGKLNPPQSGIYFLKIHGSIDWSFNISHPQNRPGSALRQTIVDISNNPLGDPQLPGIIFGRREKLRAQGPFLELLAEFDRELTTANKLVVVGYSFRDDHINELIRKWINIDDEHCISVIDPDFPTEWRGQRSYGVSDLRYELLEALGQPDSISKTPSNFSTRLKVYREKASMGLIKLLDNDPIII